MDSDNENQLDAFGVAEPSYSQLSFPENECFRLPYDCTEPLDLTKYL